jgi:hypothetical protein
MSLHLEYVDPRTWVAEKERKRHADARALATGRKSVAQLKRENEAFAFTPQKARLKLSRAKALH